MTPEEIEYYRERIRFILGDAEMIRKEFLSKCRCSTI